MGHMEFSVKQRRGPRGGSHTEAAKQKMRDRWETRKKMIYLALETLDDKLDRVLEEKE